MTCPASVAMSEASPEQAPNKFAEEGTAAHELSEACFEHNKDAKEFIGDDFNGFEVTEDMAVNVQVYVDYVRKQSKGEFKELSIEETFELDFVKEGMFGSNDACIYEEYGELEIIDLKYGMSEVQAKDNPQLKYYALGAARGGDYSHVKLTIVQPRLLRNKIKSVTMTMKELEKFETELRIAAEATEDPNAKMVMGSHCKYCRAKATCPLQKETALAIVKEDFTANPIVDLPKPNELPLKVITQILDNKDMIMEWFKSVDAYATAIAIGEGKVPPSYKLVRKKTNRKVEDPNKIIDDFSDIYGDDIYDKKLLPLGKLEKLIGKDNLADYVIKPKGEIILVPESDKRVQLTLAEAKKDKLDKLGITPVD